MPQELQVLRCYNCEAFQVHIVKKSTKWECKICGEKQSVKKVYAKGSGKDCRLYVQELNQERLKNDQDKPRVEYSTPEKNICTNAGCNNDSKPNRWAEFISTTMVNSDVEEGPEESPKYTFEQPVKKRRCTQSYTKASKTSQDSVSETINQQLALHNSNINDQQSEPDFATYNEENENKIFSYTRIPPKPFKIDKHPRVNQRLQEINQESHSNMNLSTVSTNEFSLRSSRWTEFVSCTDTSKDGDITNELLSDLEERSLKDQNFIKHLISDNENAYQTLKTDTYSGNQIKDYKHEVLPELRFNKQNKLNADQLNESKYQECHQADRNLKMGEVSDLFADRENNLDTIFTF